MNNKKQVVLGCGLLVIFGAGILAGGYYASNLLTRYLNSLDSQVAAAIFAAAGSVVAATIVVVYNQNKTRSLEIEEAHRPQKIKVYGLYVDAMTEILKRIRDNEKTDEIVKHENLIETFLQFKKELLIWGSPGVIKKYIEYEKESPSLSLKKQMLMLDELLAEFRKDLGNKNWPLTEGSLIQLFLQDRVEDLDDTPRGPKIG